MTLLDATTRLVETAFIGDHGGELSFQVITIVSRSHVERNSVFSVRESGD